MSKDMSKVMEELIQDDAEKLREEIEYFSKVLRVKKEELRRCEDALVILREEVIELHE